MVFRYGFCLLLLTFGFVACQMDGGSGRNNVNNEPVIPSTWAIADTGGMSGLTFLRYGNGRFFARGSEGVLSSVNGINWFPVDFSTTFDNNQIIFIEFIGNRWVAACNNTAAVSTNGITWTTITGQFFRGTWSGNMFLSVTATGTAHSTDLINWTEHADDVIANIGSPPLLVRVAYGNGMWVAGGASFAGMGPGGMAYSTNGINWTAVASSPLTTDIHHLTYGNGRFVAINDNHETLFSSNGINWSAGTNLSSARHNNMDFAPWASISYSGGKFIMGIGHGRIAYSINGEAWSVLPLFEDDRTMTGGLHPTSNPSFVYGGSTFVFSGVDVDMLGEQTASIIFSTDFDDWVVADLSGIFDDTFISHVVFGNRRFVAIGANGKMAYSE